MTASLPQEIIRKKRDGGVLSDQDIAAFVTGLTAGQVTDAQVAAFAMAVFFQGMTMPERVALTKAMTRSGQILDWRDLDLPGPVLDKHSTGGVGDNVSLMLAPAIAACGGFVPMISGRGLGHTGGTLDKLEAVPGYQTQPDNALFRQVVKQTGAAIIGQTADLAPADKTIYAIRDVTATVESIPLITASILAKKLAAGLDGLVMDVKTGSGAFMPSLDGARELAQSIASVATGAGLPTIALITAMDQPLASAAGNALEVQNAIDFLTGVRCDERLRAVTFFALGAELLVLGGLADTFQDGHAQIDRAYISGAAAERFGQMVAALGGPTDLMEKSQRLLPKASIQQAVVARQGRVMQIDTRAVGLAVVALGGGRTRPQDSIDHAVGFTELAAVGDEVGSQPLGVVHARSEGDAEIAAAHLRAAYQVGSEDALPLPPILERIAAQ